LETQRRVTWVSQGFPPALEVGATMKRTVRVLKALAVLSGLAFLGAVTLAASTSGCADQRGSRKAKAGSSYFPATKAGPMPRWNPPPQQQAQSSGR
jgi:hypothetical protein